MYLDRAVIVTQQVFFVFVFRGRSAMYLGKGVRTVGVQLRKDSRALEKEASNHLTSRLHIIKTAGIRAINSCFHLMAVVWPVCAANNCPPGFTVPVANSQSWSQAVKVEQNIFFSPLQQKPALGMA